MFGRRKLQQKLDTRTAQLDGMAEALREMRDERDAALARNQRLAQDLAEAKAAAKRTHDHARVLAELLEKAREANGDYELDRMEQRLHRVLRAVAALRADLADQKRVNDRLSDQLFNSLGYTDAALRALDVEPHAGPGPEVTA